jgi:hypothetical protein
MRIPQFLLNQQIILKAYLGTNSNGAQVYGEISTLDSSCIINFDESDGEYTIRARLEPAKVSIRQADRESSQFKAILFTLGTDIPTQSKIVYGGNKYIVAECMQVMSLDGISHLEVMLI